MQDFINDMLDKADIAVGFASAAAAWATSKLEWWKQLPKWQKVGVAVGVFVAAALSLSAVQALF